MKGEEDIMKKLKASTRGLIIATVLLVALSLLNWGIVSNWGKVKVTRLNLVGDDGMRYSALMYTPENATNETPAPAIMMYHGNSGNARNHESWALEFARRGMIVISVDNLGAGDSEYENALGRYVVPDLFTDYLLSLPIVDKDRWATSGHSLGGDISVTMALKYNPPVCTTSDGGAGSLSKSEQAYNGNLLMINGGADKLNETNSYRETTKTIFVNNGVMTESEQIEVGKVYGSFTAGNANLLVEIPKQIHEGAFVNAGHIEALIDFVQNSFKVPNPIAANDQIWVTKDFVGIFGMGAFVFFLLMLAMFLIDTIPFFADIRQPLPRNIGLRKVGLAISIVAAIGFPVLCLYTGSFGLVNLLGAQAPNIKLFSVKFTNIAMATVVSLNLFGLLMFVFFLLTDGKREHATIRDLGLTSEGKTKIDWVLVGKAFVLALTTVVIGWAFLKLQADALGTDFYGQFFGYKPIALYKLKYYIPYLIIWIICFVIAAVGMNVERRLPSTGKEWLDDLVAILFNACISTLAITAVLLIENATQISLGTAAKAFPTWKTDVTRLWGMPIGMFLGGAGNTYCYRKTGTIWTGAFLMGLVCALGACLYGQIQF